jgi:hypothetical protein
MDVERRKEFRKLSIDWREEGYARGYRKLTLLRRLGLDLPFYLLVAFGQTSSLRPKR